MAKKEKANKTEKTVKYHRRRGGILYAAVAVVLIAASLVAACTVFFRVESVTVEGNERYSTEEILSVASVEMGANMILTPSQQIADAVTSALPYVDQVEVQKRFPTTVNLVITECQPVAVITGAASAWVIDAKGKLLEQADETRRSLAWNCWNPSREPWPRPPWKTRISWRGWWPSPRPCSPAGSWRGLPPSTSPPTRRS